MGARDQVHQIPVEVGVSWQDLFVVGAVGTYYFLCGSVVYRLAIEDGILTRAECVFAFVGWPMYLLGRAFGRKP